MIKGPISAHDWTSNCTFNISLRSVSVTFLWRARQCVRPTVHMDHPPALPLQRERWLVPVQRYLRTELEFCYSHVIRECDSLTVFSHLKTWGPASLAETGGGSVWPVAALPVTGPPTTSWWSYLLSQAREGSVLTPLTTSCAQVVKLTNNCFLNFNRQIEWKAIFFSCYLHGIHFISSNHHSENEPHKDQ